MRRYARDAAWAREALCDAYLEPNALWFYTLVDRRDRAILCTANRHYSQLDEPDRPIEPALDALLRRWEADDPDLLVMPRMSNAEREELMHTFAETLADAGARTAFDERARDIRARWDDYWRPGSFQHLVDDLAWRAHIHAPAEAAVARFCAEHGIRLDRLDHIVFD